jgi:hypothetical protein
MVKRDRLRRKRLASADRRLRTAETDFAAVTRGIDRAVTSVLL